MKTMISVPDDLSEKAEEVADARDPRRLFWRLSALSAVVVALLYSIPLLLGAVRHHGLIDVYYGDEMYYAARVVDAYRGGDLRNPYLAGHSNSPKYAPELVERALALLARSLGMTPLALLAASRVVLPVAVSLLLAVLARALGLRASLAVMAGAAPALFPPILTLVESAYSGQHGFLRLFRIVSPAGHMLLLIIALQFVVIAWKRGSTQQGVAAGAVLGALAFTPIYYWSFAIGGTLLLALLESGRRRRALLVSIAVALFLLSPHLIAQAELMRSADVRETLARFRLMVSGRAPEAQVLRRAVENAVVITTLLLLRRRIGSLANFLLAFLTAGELLLIQNAITNRQMQSYHWMHCLFLLWPIAAAAVWQSVRRSGDGGLLVAISSIVVFGALLVQLIAFAHWEIRRYELPELYALDEVMPETISWLNRNTPPGTVVIGPPAVMESLPIFTHDKVYWAEFAGQHVVSDREVRQRVADVGRGARYAGLHFRADFALMDGARCTGSAAAVFRSPRESTCVVPLADSAR